MSDLKWTSDDKTSAYVKLLAQEQTPEDFYAAFMAKVGAQKLFEVKMLNKEREEKKVEESDIWGKYRWTNGYGWLDGKVWWLEFEYFAQVADGGKLSIARISQRQVGILSRNDTKSKRLTQSFKGVSEIKIAQVGRFPHYKPIFL